MEGERGGRGLGGRPTELEPPGN